MSPSSERAHDGLEPDGGFDDRRFAEERSHLDAQTVGEHARACAQTTILVNGGAATAALAFAAGYEGLSTGQSFWLALGVVAYAAGVAVGAFDLGTLTKASFSYMTAWELVARGHDATAAFDAASKSRRRGDLMFRTGIGLFGLGSVLLAGALIFLPPRDAEPATVPPPPTSLEAAPTATGN